MESSLSDLVNTFSETVHRIKCKFGHDDKKCETCEIKYNYFECFREYINFENDLIEQKCLRFDKNYQHKFDEKLKERFFNTYKVSNHDNNYFILFLQKGIYLYEYMDDWEKFNETSLLEKDICSDLNMEDITDAGCAYAKRACKDFKIKILEEYHDLFVQSDALLLVDVSENFRNMCLKIYEVDAAEFLSVPGLAWQATLKKAKVKLNLLTDNDMLLTAEKGITGEIYHCI